MSELDKAKEFVAEHEKDLDEAQGKHRARTEAGQEFTAAHEQDSETAVPESRDL